MDVLVKLSREELNDCSQAAALRWQLARLSGVKNQRKDDLREDQDVDLLGIKAEVAVAKAYNLNFNPYALGIDDGVDMFSGDLGIDVKASFHRDGHLIFKKLSSFRADIAVFVTGSADSDTLRIAGWIGRDRFESACHILSTGKGREAVAVSQKLLATPENLWAFLTNRKAN